jgi:hypothetical protein
LCVLRKWRPLLLRLKTHVPIDAKASLVVQRAIKSFSAGCAFPMEKMDRREDKNSEARSQEAQPEANRITVVCGGAKRHALSFGQAAGSTGRRKSAVVALYGTGGSAISTA